MRPSFLAFSPPSIGEEEIAEVVAALRSDWITTGPRVKRFEEAFATRVNGQAALALNSGTAALHVALKTLGIGPGDAVITTPMTFCSTVHVIEHVGATPVLVDVDPVTLNIDPKCAAAAADDLAAGRRAEGRPRALLPVHLYGQPCDMDALIGVARAHRLAVVEDAAHALPAKHGGRMIGDTGVTPDVERLVCFSFYATKNMTTAEGGMLVGAPALVDEARVWSLHGMSRDAWKRYSAEGSWFYEVVRPGFKYNMPDIQAALGLVQLGKLDGFAERRRAIARRYREAFASFEELEVPAADTAVEHAWHLFVIKLRLDLLAIDRARFIKELHERNIGASVHFIPVHLHPYYRDRYGFKPDDFPVAHRQYQRIVSLPIHPGLAADDVEHVVGAVVDVIKRFRR